MPDILEVEEENPMKKEVKKPKGSIYYLNLFFLIISMPAFGFAVFVFVLVLVGHGWFEYLCLIVFFGEPLTMTGFMLSSKREKTVRSMNEESVEDNSFKIRKILEISLSILGTTLIVTGTVILARL